MNKYQSEIKYWSTFVSNAINLRMQNKYFNIMLEDQTDQELDLDFKEMAQWGRYSLVQLATNY